MKGSPFPRMSEADATAWVTVECQAGSEPCLDTTDVAHLLAGAKRADLDDRKPSDPKWVPTYDLAWAAWKGWTLKAGKAALMVDVSTPGGLSVSKSQVRAACLEMANQYARGVLQSVAVVTEGSREATGILGIGSPGTTYGNSGETLPDPDSLDVFGSEDPAFVNGLPVV